MFLFLAGSGTPNILYIFWPTLILWLGSKIIGARRQHPIIFTLLILAITSSVYTPHFVYIALLILTSIIIHPHIRFSIKILKLPQIIIGTSIALLTLVPLIVSCALQPSLVPGFFLSNSDLPYLDTIANAFAPFFSFGSAIESVYLSPLFGLGTIALVVVGAIFSTSKMFTSRNTIVSLLFIFSILMSGLDPATAAIVFIPIAILVAAAIEAILEKWYAIFPENPYARIFGVVPIGAFILLIIISGLVYTVFGYHYTPAVAKHFDNDLELVRQYAPDSTHLLLASDTLDYDFYKILERKPSTHIVVSDTLPSDQHATVITLGKWQEDIELPLSQIITSPKQQNSDRLYIYNNLEK